MTTDWLAFWDSPNSIYVNARHKDVHYRLIAKEIAALVPGPEARVLDYGCGEALHADLVAAAAGDVVVLPAGTGHQCLWAAPELTVIGAYPNAGKYDLCRGSKAEHARAVETIPNVPLPDTDPVFGPEGPLMSLWRA